MNNLIKFDPNLQLNDIELLKNGLLKESIKYKKTITFHPVQDFVQEKLHYGFKHTDNQIWIVNSKKDLTPLKDLTNLKPVVEDINSNNFPIHLIESILNGSYNVIPYEIFQSIKSYVEQYTQFESKLESPIISLWTIGTYLFKMFTYFPYINLNGEKGSGKTNLMQLLKPIAFNGDLLSSPTEAVLFRSTHNELNTLFLDEAEKLYRGSKAMINSDIGSILNTGFHCGGSVKRCESNDFKPKSFSTYCPKMIANISSVENVLSDRMIPIRMIRKTEHREKYIPTDIQIQNKHQELSDKLYVLGLQFSDDVYTAYKKILNNSNNEEILPNRSLDLWSPLLAIAEVVDPTRSLYQKIMDYAVKNRRDKIEDDIEENATAKLFDKLMQLVLDPYEKESTSKNENFFVIPAKNLYTYLSQNDIYYSSLHKLTKKLKPILRDGESKNMRSENGDQGRHYSIDLNKFYKSHKTYCE